MTKRDYESFATLDDAVIKAERKRARELRKSRWWQQKTGSGLCYYCGERVAYKNITMDHLVPLTRGGRSTKDNIVPCCKTCNNLKKDMLPLEWQDYLERKTRQK